MRLQVLLGLDRCRDRASDARENAPTTLSPSPCSTGRTPPCLLIARSRIPYTSPTALPIVSGNADHSRVEPSMSLIKNVTVPAGT
jgi:hypothetical protein